MPDPHATGSRAATEITLKLYVNAVGLWVWVAYTGDGSAPGSAKGGAGGFGDASAALTDALERFPALVNRIEEAWHGR